jgi:hypothetical protein
MKIVDLLGSELKPGDLVAVKSDHICAVVVRVEDGAIAKGLSISGKPAGAETPPHIITKVQFTTIIPAIGGTANVLKLEKPPQEEKNLVQ